MRPRTQSEASPFLGSQGVCHTVALPFALKKRINAKEELWKLKYVSMQNINLQKIL
jgi:hypothetical protein